MTHSRSVLITGASRGLGLATAAHLYAEGWTVLAGMRSVETGLEAIREVTGAKADDPRLIGVRLDLTDSDSIAAAARATTDAVGAPDAVVHNAGVAAVGTVEEFPQTEWDTMYATNFFGPMRLTRELLPTMRAAGRGRIVVVSSVGATRGMPGISAYSSVKGALERWAESLAIEISPFGIGVTVLVAGTFKTDILELTTMHGDTEGPYGTFLTSLDANGRRAVSIAAEPSKFAKAVAKAVLDTRPFTRRSVGADAKAVVLGSRMIGNTLLGSAISRALKLPKPGSLAQR